MKKLSLTLMFAAAIITSCSKKESASVENPQAEPATTAQDNQQPTPEISANTASNSDTPEAQGEKLIEGADCLSCHKVDSKLVGPAYKEVAAKYTDADIDHLASKIIEGGKGVWGDIPMTPHTGLSKENARLMVKYILSLKK